jgi:hypothetical protein
MRRQADGQPAPIVPCGASETIAGEVVVRARVQWPSATAPSWPALARKLLDQTDFTSKRPSRHKQVSLDASVVVEISFVIPEPAAPRSRDTSQRAGLRENRGQRDCPRRCEVGASPRLRS